MNFVKAFKYPVVFRNLIFDKEEKKYYLIYGGDLRTPFNPDSDKPEDGLLQTQDGYLLHGIQGHKHGLSIGCFDTSLSMEFSDYIDQSPSGAQFINWKGTKYPLRTK